MLQSLIRRSSGGVYPSTVGHVTGISLTAVAPGVILCAFIELLTTNTDTLALLFAGLCTLAVGVTLWMGTSLVEVRHQQVFVTVGCAWVATTLFGALPFIMAGTFAVSGADFVEQIVNSVFESASGFSCTGSTVLVNFERPGQGLLMYRQLTQWYGGMGVVVLAVAVLPFLGVGGLDLIAAEAPGPWSDRLTPRVSETARHLWGIYIGLTLTATVALFAIPDVSLYDAVAHALTVASTGGFSPYANSVGHFDSAVLETVLVIFMLLGGANFSLHWHLVRNKNFLHLSDSEFRSYLFVILTASTAVTMLLWLGDGHNLLTSLRMAVFNVVSLGTSTGFGNATDSESLGNYVIWGAGSQMMLLFLMIVGGCSGSTSGGIKIIRAQILGIITLRSIRSVRMPRTILPARLGSSFITEDVIMRVVGFYLIHLMLVVAGFLILTAFGAQLDTAIGASISALGNMGPALGEAGPTDSYADVFNQPSRVLLSLWMVVGRLEIMPIVLIMFIYFSRFQSFANRLRKTDYASR